MGARTAQHDRGAPWPKNLRGVGRQVLIAANTLDYPAVNGVSLFGGAAFLLANLVTDVTYALVDPKIRLA